MIATPTHLVDVLGGPVTTDQYGDQVEGAEVIAARVPAAIREQRAVVATESDPQAKTVRYYTGRLPNGTPVTGANRLRDVATGELYLIDYATTPAHPAMEQDVRLDLRRAS
ncbi:MAG TPA: hypothetical protein VFU47_12900 [Armatimonadota bacterium]|nr:hypothetical protein [Armatimonadota bacterium]